MTEEIATYGDGSTQSDQLTIWVNRKLSKQFQDKLKEHDQEAGAVIERFIANYVSGAD